MKICGDNDIIWGTHLIVGHKELEVNDIDFYLATTRLTHHQISDKLKEYLADYHSPHGGVSISIRPDKLLVNEEEKMEIYTYKYDLTEKHNQKLKEELFLCIGLDKNAGFDDFAEKFGGLKKKEILKKIIK